MVEAVWKQGGCEVMVEAVWRQGGCGGYGRGGVEAGCVWRLWLRQSGVRVGVRLWLRQCGGWLCVEVMLEAVWRLWLRQCGGYG